MTVDYLNANYKMVGLSSDWVNRAWQIDGDYDSGRIVFDNEDGTYVLFDFFYEGDDEDELHTTTLVEGSIEEVCAKL